MSIDLPARSWSPALPAVVDLRDQGPPLTCVPTPYDHPQAQALAAALHREQLATYGFADDPSRVPVDSFTSPGVFLLGVSDDAGQWALACGGLAFLQPEVAEVRKMFVRQGFRGLGWGHVLLDALHDHAQAHGARRLVLETGCRNLSAIHLYRRHGFTAIEPYVAGRNPAINRAFAKNLDA